MDTTTEQQQKDVAIVSSFQNHESRIQALERSASRDTEVLDLILRLNTMIGSALEERAGLIAKISRLETTAIQLHEDNEHLQQMVGRADQIIGSLEHKQQEVAQKSTLVAEASQPKVKSKKD